jgi:hypothetical protein
MLAIGVGVMARANCDALTTLSNKTAKRLPEQI